VYLGISSPNGGEIGSPGSSLMWRTRGPQATLTGELVLPGRYLR
jgi:hypothetical protein